MHAQFLIFDHFFRTPMVKNFQEEIKIFWLEGGLNSLLLGKSQLFYSNIGIPSPTQEFRGQETDQYVPRYYHGNTMVLPCQLHGNTAVVPRYYYSSTSFEKSTLVLLQDYCGTTTVLLHLKKLPWYYRVTTAVPRQ